MAALTPKYPSTLYLNSSYVPYLADQDIVLPTINSTSLSLIYVVSLGDRRQSHALFSFRVGSNALANFQLTKGTNPVSKTYDILQLPWLTDALTVGGTLIEKLGYTINTATPATQAADSEFQLTIDIDGISTIGIWGAATETTATPPVVLPTTLDFSISSTKYANAY